MNGRTAIRVVLADDHAMVREALARILDEDPGVSVAAQACHGDEIIPTVEREQPDVLVLDYSMPGQETPSCIERLVQQFPGLKILVLTVHENLHYAVRVLEAGAQGYLIKAAAADELLRAIKQVSRDQVYVSETLASDVFAYLRRPRRQRVGLESLSQREFDFLRIYGSGKGLQACAREMKISNSTASTYRSRIMEKLQLDSTTELIRFALESRIVE